MNRATADNQSAQAEEEGLEPTKEWVKDLIDEILAEEFASGDLELHWLDEDKDDPEALYESRLKVGAVTLNEMRDALGLDPYDNAATDRPMVLAATGYVPIEANAGGAGRGRVAPPDRAARALRVFKNTVTALTSRVCRLEVQRAGSGRATGYNSQLLPKTTRKQQYSSVAAEGIILCRKLYIKSCR